MWHKDTKRNFKKYFIVGSQDNTSCCLRNRMLLCKMADRKWTNRRSNKETWIYRKLQYSTYISVYSSRSVYVSVLKKQGNKWLSLPMGSSCQILFYCMWFTKKSFSGVAMHGDQWNQTNLVSLKKTVVVVMWWTNIITIYSLKFLHVETWL